MFQGPCNYDENYRSTFKHLPYLLECALCRAYKDIGIENDYVESHGAESLYTCMRCLLPWHKSCVTTFKAGNYEADFTCPACTK